MNPLLSGPKWTLACLAICLAGAPVGFLRAQQLSLDLALVDLPELPSVPPELGQAIDEQEQRLQEEHRLRMRFFQAIAANDKTTLRQMLNQGMDPNAELPFPIPAEFRQRFNDDLLRYYVAGEEGFTGLMLATALGNHTFVKILLLAGADPWKLTKRHKTYALWLAAKYKNIEIMRSLMGIGPGHPSEAFRITIDLSTQTASLWRNGKVILATPISSGRPSHPTPPRTLFGDR